MDIDRNNAGLRTEKDAPNGFLTNMKQEYVCKFRRLIDPVRIKTRQVAEAPSRRLA